MHRYRIRVERRLGAAPAALFPGIDVGDAPDGGSVLTGDLPDQAALHGVLARLRDLGLELVEVRRLPDDPAAG